jgi:ribosome modulation factor
MQDIPKHDTENPRAWEEGYQSGLHDLARSANPYPSGTDAAKAWTAGYLKGIAEIRKLESK